MKIFKLGLFFLVLAVGTIFLPSVSSAAETESFAKKWLRENGAYEDTSKAEFGKKKEELNAKLGDLKNEFEDIKKEMSKETGFWNKFNSFFTDFGNQIFQFARYQAGKVFDNKESQAKALVGRLKGMYAKNPEDADLAKALTIAETLIPLAIRMDNLQYEKDKVDDFNNCTIYVYETKTADGKTSKTLLCYDDEHGTLKSVSGVTQSCMPLSAKLAENRSCIFCPLFLVIFNAAQNMATTSYNNLGTEMIKVVLIAFAILLAYKTLILVSSFVKQDAPKFITEMSIQAFKVIVAVLLLSNSTAIYTYALGPVLGAGFEFGTSLMFSNDYVNTCKDSSVSVSGGVLPTYLYTKIKCFIEAVQQDIAVPQSIGSTFMCVARYAGQIDVGPIKKLLWDFGMMFQGLIIWVFAWIMALAFAFYLVDATVRLGIVGALMPFLIGAWPFKVTVGYAKTGWTMIMNTFFTYVFMGLVISIAVTLMGESLSGANGGWKAIMAAANGDEIEKLKDLLDIGLAGMLVLIACCLFGFKMIGQTSSLAESMAGGGGTTNIAPGIGTLGASAATQVAQKGTKMAWRTAGKPATNWVGGKIQSGAVATGKWAGGKIKAGNAKIADAFANIKNKSASSQTPAMSSSTPRPVPSNTQQQQSQFNFATASDTQKRDVYDEYMAGQNDVSQTAIRNQFKNSAEGQDISAKLTSLRQATQAANQRASAARAAEMQANSQIQALEIANNDPSTPDTAKANNTIEINRLQTEASGHRADYMHHKQEENRNSSELNAVDYQRMHQENNYVRSNRIP